MQDPSPINSNPIRCLLGMLGTDVHSKGIRTLAQMLREAGIEVIYIGEHNTVQGMVRSILVEDVDLVGLSFLSSNYLDYSEQLLEEMRQQELGDVPLMLGGIIHKEDEPALKQIGVSGIFGPGSTLSEILDFIQTATGKALASAKPTEQ